MSQQRQFKGLPSFTPSSPPEPSPTWSPPFQPPYTPLPNVQQQWFMQPGQTSHCSRCGKELGFIDRIGLDKQTPRCRTCSNQKHQSLQRFRKTFLDVTRSGMFSANEWAALQYAATQERLDKSEALTFIMKDSIALIERVITQAETNGNITEEVDHYVSQLLSTLSISPEFSKKLLSRLASAKLRVSIQRLERAISQAEAQGELTDEAERHISQLQATLSLPQEFVQPVLQRLAQLKRYTNIQRFRRAMAQIEADGEVTDEDEQSMMQLHRSFTIPDEIAHPILRRVAYLKKLTHIRKGNLPAITTNVQLESDEICHLEMPATYHKVNAKSMTYLAGRLVATNKRLHFLSTTRGMTINWSNIMRVEVRSSVPSYSGVYLELSKGTGNGLYAVSDPTLVGAVLDTLVKIAKRQLVVTNTEPSRHIPQDVKNAVWQRDGGKCTQCGSTIYLEFDHIIPHTKGGANTVANVQLLCRSCNLKKSDRI
jgi:HNH endonuclease